MRIVLAHGFPGFVAIPVISEDFRGVAADLQNRFQNLQVLTPQVDPFGATSDRAKQLLPQIPNTGDRVHIIAHSAGGLDARFLVSPGGLGRADLVASITTISTPHLGSQVADLLANPTQEIAPLIPQLAHFAAGVGGFTTSAMLQFNRDITEAHGVDYFSYAGITGLSDRGALGTIFLTSYPL